MNEVMENVKLLEPSCKNNLYEKAEVCEALFSTSGFWRPDYKAGGLNPPHTHPRATEIVFVLDGELDVGFISTSNKLISKSIKNGEIFVFPKGLVHYQKNNGDKPASVLSAFDSQLPGTVSIAAALITSTPTVPDNVLAQAFQIDTTKVDDIKAKLAPKKT
ncbi:hypothetical protein AAZX31_02G007900 [Glycine max]